MPQTHVWMYLEENDAYWECPVSYREIALSRGWVDCDPPEEDLYAGLVDPGVDPPESLVAAVEGSQRIEVEDGYDDLVKKDLEALIDRRNEGREADDLIVVAGKRNKPDLIKALEADDAAATATDTTEEN